MSAQSGRVGDAAIAHDGRLPMSPELHMLIACIRGQTAPTADVDWDRLGALAVTHGVAPFANLALQGLPTAPPAGLLEDLGRFRRSSALMGAFALKQRDEVLHILQQDDIPYLVLKGAALARTWYGDPSLRPFGDIDLLVSADDTKRARHALLRAGYRETSGSPTSYHGVPLYHPNRPCAVEIHHRLTCLPLQQALSFDQLYARAMPASIEGAHVVTLGPEDTLLHLCLHLLNHMQTTQGWKLSYLCDITRHIAVFAIDWKTFSARTRALGAYRSCGAVLGAAALIAGAEVPPDQIESVATLELLCYPITDRTDVSHHFLAAFLAALARAELRQASTMLLRAMATRSWEGGRPTARDLRPQLLLRSIRSLLREIFSAPQDLHHQLKAWLPEGETLVGRERLVADLFSLPDT